MRIKYIYTFGAGPLGAEWSVDLTNDWNEKVYEQVLLSGPNGSGKSSILKVIAYLWDALDYWLTVGGFLPSNKPERSWLKKWGGSAIILENVIPEQPLVGVIYGDDAWHSRLAQQHPDVVWIGEVFSSKGASGRQKRTLLPGEDEEWYRKWSFHKKRSVILGESIAETPNLVYLDAEERRWVSPKKRVGETIPDNPKQLWLTTYRVTEDWEGQVESGLLNLKLIDEQKYYEVVRNMNTFLYGKEIDPVIRSDYRIRVKIKDPVHPTHHSLDELSAGERQVLILIFILSRWLEPGGIVLVDEPDLHFHPSLQSGLLAILESIVKKHNGQLFITSHIPDVWERYEAFGKRIRLGALT